MRLQQSGLLTLSTKFILVQSFLFPLLKPHNGFIFAQQDCGFIHSSLNIGITLGIHFFMPGMESRNNYREQKLLQCTHGHVSIVVRQTLSQLKSPFVCK